MRTMDKTAEDRVIRLAEQMVDYKAKGHSLQLDDTTCTVWDLAHVSPRVRLVIEAAAELAELDVEISKVGDYARVRFV